MSFSRLHPIAAAAAALLIGQSAVAAVPAADHPAVQRAQAHLQGPGFAAVKHSGSDDFSARDLIVDSDGSEHVRFERSHRGLRVLGGDVVVHGDGSGSFKGVSLTQAAMIQMDLRPKLGAAAASRIALGQYSHRNGEVQGAELVVHAMGKTPRLAWDVRVTGVQADGTPSRAHLIVDATGKKVIDQWDDIHTADDIGSGKTLYSGTVALHDDLVGTTYSLKDATRGGHYVVTMKNGTTTETQVSSTTDNVWGNGATSDAESAAADAAYGQNLTWDYYKNVHGRNGIANDGRGARSRVHYSSKYDNAYWDDTCFCMTYGDGSGGNTGFSPLVSIDVAGHEMTHGVTSRTANLAYRAESGGLNEATSDIFGTMVEFYAGNANDAGDYLIGEKLSATPLRYMYQPSLDGASADCWYSSAKRLDVHYSSGIANHFYFLLAEGTTAGVPSKTCVSGNTRVATGTGTLAGIGRAKAEKIWYRALTVYMTSSTNYAGARTATTSAATDLYGATSPEVAAVKAAWTAVNN
jgi:Zn-dependent metalloprotease